MIGVDEAGRGPLFGRVYVSAFYINPDLKQKIDLLNTDKILIRDSKKMKPANIEKIKDILTLPSNDFIYSVNYGTEEEIDTHNILKCTIMNMNKCIVEIINILKEKNIFSEDIKILIDGTYFKQLSDFSGLKWETVKGGDDIHFPISCASILAKSFRDKYILDIDDEELNEKYKIKSNKGYGTKAHIEGIKKYGLSKYHRKSFKLKK